MGFGCEYPTLPTVVRYIFLVLLIQITSDLTSYYVQHMYHEMCCNNFAQYFMMKGSSICNAMKNVDSLISPKILTAYMKIK